MNSVIATPPPHPHQLYNPRLSPSRSMLPSNGSSSRKRKAEDNEPQDDRMSSSPIGSPSALSRPLPIQRQNKRAKSGAAGRPLALPRLLETLDADSLRGLLRSICVRHPAIGNEVVETAPRPSVAAALNVLKTYESTLQSSFPYGGDHTSDYAYNRVRQALVSLLDALVDFTPHFLPPHETSATQALNFLDGATEVIHRLPNWSSYQNNLHKQGAYEEISKAWALVVREAAKRAGGIQLQYGGWDQKLARHNQQAGGKLQEAINEMTSNLGWMHNQPQQHSNHGDDLSSIREELLSGTYGNNLPVHVGPW